MFTYALFLLETFLDPNRLASQHKTQITQISTIRTERIKRR